MIDNTQKRFKVLGLGTTCVDKIAIFNEKLMIHEKASTNQYRTFCGGNMANTLVGLSRLEIDCEILTVIGIDDEGDFILNKLKQEGVQTNKVIRQGQSSFAFIAVEKQTGNRTIYTCRGPTYKEEIPLNDESLLNNVDIIYVDGRFHESALKLLQLAKQKKILIVVEAEKLDFNLEKLIPLADIVKTSKRFSQEYFQSDNYQDNLDKLLQMGPSIAITTLCENGSIGRTGDNIFVIPKIDVKVIDKTGAGDAYSAGLIYGLLQKWPLNKIMQFATQVAAIKCEKEGSQDGLPYLKDVKI